jgi:DNA-binding NarL/FixJ family response regulator
MLRIFVIENHETILVSGLRQLFRPHRDQIEITGSSNSVANALQNKELESCDIIILDLWIPNEKPLENVSILRQKYPKAHIIILTTEESPVWIRKMMAAGVKGYLIKNTNRNELKSAIMKVAGGGTWFTASLDEENQEKTAESSDKTNIVLNPAQKEILSLLTQGKNIKEIAELLNSKPAKIEKTLVNLRKQYQAETNIALIKILLDKGII